MVSDISRFANTQNVVRQSDLSANKPFHVDVERLSMNVFCPDGVGKWFYERAAGSYNTLLSREGTTPARLRALKDAVPPARKITKTDLAKYLVAWDGLPDVVSLGSQKCFDRFMSSMTVEEGLAQPPPPDVAAFKAMVCEGRRVQEDSRSRPADVPRFPGQRRRLHSSHARAQVRREIRPWARLGPPGGVTGAARPVGRMGTRGQRCAAPDLRRQDGFGVGQEARVPRGGFRREILESGPGDSGNSLRGLRWAMSWTVPPAAG